MKDVAEERLSEMLRDIADRHERGTLTFDPSTTLRDAADALDSVVKLRDEWRNEGPDCTHALCESEHNSGCGASSCFAKDIDEMVFGIKYE